MNDRQFEGKPLCALTKICNEGGGQEKEWEKKKEME